MDYIPFGAEMEVHGSRDGQYELTVTRAEQEDAINVALVVGGSIVIPHLRRAYQLLTELYG